MPDDHQLRELRAIVRGDNIWAKPDDDLEVVVRRIPPFDPRPITAEEQAIWLAGHGRITLITRGNLTYRYPEPDER